MPDLWDQFPDAGGTAVADDPFSDFPDGDLRPDHNAQWNQMERDSIRDATAAGLPVTTDSRQRLIDAIGRTESAGFKTPHFIGLPDEPTGDRGVTRDVENLVSSLKQQEAAATGADKEAISKQRAYWEREMTANGMSAEQWREQTGEDDPKYPHETFSGNLSSGNYLDAAKIGLGNVMRTPAKLALAGSYMANQGKLEWPTDQEVQTPTLPRPVAEGIARGLAGPASLLIPSQGDSIPAKALEGVTNTVQGASSPENIALLGLAPEGKLAQRLIAGTFLGQSLLGTPEQWQAFKDAPTAAEKTRIGVEMGLGLALPAAGLAHSFKGEVPKPSETSLPDLTYRSPDRTSQGLESSSDLPSPETQTAQQIPRTNVERTGVESTSESSPLRPQPETSTAAPESASTTRDAEFQAMSSKLNELNKDQFLPDRATDAPQEPTSTKNEVTASEREARGIPAAEETAAREFGTVWDEAAAAAEKDPSAPERLVQSINDNPRALSDHENALLLRRQIEVQAEHDAAVKGVNDNPGDVEAQSRLDAARDNVQAVYDAAKSAGTETGRGLNARKMLANEDYSLAKMEAQMRAEGGGRPLPPKHLAEVKKLHQKIADLTTQLEAKEEFKTALQTTRRTRVRAFSPVEFLEKREAAARERILARRGRLYADPLGVTHVAHLADEAIIGAAHIARGVRNLKEWSAAMIKDFGDGIKPYLKALFARSQAMHSEAARLAAAKGRAVGQTVKTLSKIGANDLTHERPIPIRPDRELLELRANLQRAKDEFAKRLERQRQANMPMGKKIANTFVKAERAMKLTGIPTLGKLGGAGVTRLVSSAVEEAVGGILSKIPGFRQIAEAAPREGGFSARAEVGALTTGLGRGIRNIPKILKGVRTNEDAVFGKQNQHLYYESGSPLDIPGRIHGAIKSPFKEAERERSTIKRQIAEERRGGDPHDPATELEIGKAAYKDANRAIFMQDNILSDGYRAMTGMMERNKKFPTAGFIGAKVANFLLPIVKVPTNVALETLTHLTGTASASYKLMQVMRRGLNTIRPEEADLITRHYKKGLVGVGLFLTGLFNADKFGGFYSKDSRDPNDVKAGGARIAGVNIPPWLLHAPAFIVMQAGATAARMFQKGGYSSALAVADGLVHEIPFVNEMGRIDHLLSSGYEGTKERGNLLRSSVVPQGVQNVADWTDSAGKQAHRSPKDELDYLKMGVPGLRQQVPFATHKLDDQGKALGVMSPEERDAYYNQRFNQASPNNKKLRKALDPSLPLETRDRNMKEYLDGKIESNHKKSERKQTLDQAMRERRTGQIAEFLQGQAG